MPNTIDLSRTLPECVHDFKPSFTGKINGEIITHYLCQCGKTKKVKGDHTNYSDNTWASSPAKYTK